MTGSVFAPTKMDEFSSKNVNLHGVGTIGTATAGTTSNIDYTFTDDCFIVGAILNVKDAAFGDSVTFQVIDPSNLFGLGVNAVLKQFITNWYMVSDQQRQYDETIAYPAKIFAGLTVRLIYTSTGIISPSVSINYKAHIALY